MRRTADDSIEKRVPRKALRAAFGLLIVHSLLSGCAFAIRPLWPGDTGENVQQSERSTAASELRAAEIETPVIPRPAATFPIDLTTALRLAEAENPLIAEARQSIGLALATRQQSLSLLLPSLNIGTNFHAHTGDLQRSSGAILKLDSQSLYFGGGAFAVGSRSPQIPAISIFSPITDAVFEPMAASQMVRGARFGAWATANRVLLEVAELHLELLAARSDLNVRRETATEAAEIVRLTAAYLKAGQGRAAEARRAETEYTLILNETHYAEEQLAVAAARLSQRLHLDQSIRLEPIATSIELLTIVDPLVPLPDLIQAALRGRPEIGQASATLAEAEVRRQQEIYRPLLPTLAFGFSAGAFGGGSNLVSNDLSHFGPRTDLDVMVFWTASNFGLGNLSLIRQRRAQVGRATGEQSRTIAAVRSEVAAAVAEVIARRRQVELTTLQVKSAERGFKEDLQRIRNTVGRPIEVVNSVQLLNQARVARIRAVTDYNKAEFRLFVALGSPPPLGAPSNAPLPPAPVATPPLPPLDGLGTLTPASLFHLH
jgi:outer membrane protein TolC